MAKTKIQVNTTLDPGNVKWLDDRIAENRFPSRSAGVDMVISMIRRLESPEAATQRAAEETRLRDAEARAKRAEAALETIRSEIENEIMATLTPMMKEMMRQAEVTAKVQQGLGEYAKRMIQEAYDEARAEREKRARAEDYNFEIALEAVRARDEVQKLRAEIEELKGAKAETADGE